jgi:hypothetical protein
MNIIKLIDSFCKLAFVKEAYIRKEEIGGQTYYVIKSHKGKNLGKYKSKKKAEKRLKQIEMFKHFKQ